MRKDRKTTGIIIAFAVAVLVIIIMHALIVFHIAIKTTKESGKYRLESISASIEESINSSKTKLTELAVSADPYLDDIDMLEDFLYEKRDELYAETDGICFNAYAAGRNWMIIPDLPDDTDYNAWERIWFTGAKDLNGKVYVTDPYIDVVTGKICYTVSILMGDGKTVIALDFLLNDIQNQIEQLSIDGVTTAFVVTEDGIIAGCHDESYVATVITEAFPEYTGIFNLVKGKSTTVSARLKTGIIYDIVFATNIVSGWYLLIGINNWNLYELSYIQLIITTILNVLLFVTVILFYTISKNNELKTQEALKTKEEFLSSVTSELKLPLKQIISSTENPDEALEINYETRYNTIKDAAKQLSESINQIITYSSVVNSEKQSRIDKKQVHSERTSIRFRNLIVLQIILAMIVSLIITSVSTRNWGNASMRENVSVYENEVSEWIKAQKSVLDMFTSVISTNPDMLDSYHGTIDYLDKITAQYADISASYIANPERKLSVYMNSGWKPQEGWKVEDRQWYIDTINSETGWNISSPYYDIQTGEYCVTFSKMIYSYKTGDFLGVFGIDFYMDKLIEILGSTYTGDSYAFLVDPSGVIINHPYGKYQMSDHSKTRIAELGLKNIVTDGKHTTVIKDYDGGTKVLIAKKSKYSDFTVYCIYNYLTIYGRVFTYALITLAIFAVFIFAVYKMLSDMLKVQADMKTQLQESVDAAIAAGKAKSDFLAMMSHEIRTPINAVLGMNEMILRESGDEEINGYANNIASAGRTLLTLINSILDFSKIEEGKMEIVPVSYETKIMISDILNMISERVNKKGLKLIPDIDTTLPSALYGDDVRISQIIINLLTNAVKYTDEGSVTLSIYGNEVNNDEIELVVKVIDTGRGIKDTDIDKLSTSFSRLDEKKNRNIEGTGLGISIVTSLLNMMNSKLEVESTYGEGSTFSFKLRQRVVRWNKIGYFDYEKETLDRKNLETEYLVAEHADILVVDDNEMNLSVVKSLLKKNQISPELASSGEKCISEVRSRHYDIIFLDHMMPEMDGIVTLHKMKEENILPRDTKVIALTANAVSGAKENYLNEGFDDYLSKPVDYEVLIRMLVKYLPSYKYHFVKVNPNDAEKAENKKKINTENAESKKNTDPENTKVTKPEDEDIIEFLPAGEAAQKESASEETSSEEKKEPSAMDKMKAIECIDAENAAKLCGSEEAYIEIAKLFLKNLETKRDEIRKFKEEGDIPNYVISVHSLKSSAKLLGANEMSELARELELAGKAGNLEPINEKTDKLLEWYDIIYKEISFLGNK